MRIEASAVVVPLRVPATLSTRERQGREYAIVQVVDESGACGIGYTYAGDSGGAWLGSGIDELLALLADRPERLHDRGSLGASVQRPPPFRSSRCDPADARKLWAICEEVEPPLVEAEPEHQLSCHIPVEELRRPQTPTTGQVLA